MDSQQITLDVNLAISLLTNHFSNLSKEKMALLIEQLILSKRHTINEILVYLDNPEEYVSKDGHKLNDLVYVSKDAFWGQEIKYYEDQNLLVDNSIQVKISSIALLNDDKVHVEYIKGIDHKGNFVYNKKDVYSSYIKKLELF